MALAGGTPCSSPRRGEVRPKDGVRGATVELTQSKLGRARQLRRDGTAGTPTILDSGTSVFVDAVQEGATGEWLVAGGVGGQATIFHLKARDADPPASRQRATPR